MRVWILLLLMVLVVVVVVAVKNVAQGLGDRRLINAGHAVDATIELIYGASRNVDRSVSRDLKLSYHVPGEEDRRLLEHTMLTPVYAVGEPGEDERNKPIVLKPTNRYMNPGDKLPIRVDRADPRRWTDRLDPPSWLATLAVPLMLLPIVFVLLLIARLRRQRLLGILRDGVPRQANVVEIHRSALVPGQRVVKCSIVGGDGRILATTLPDALPAPERGEMIDVIVDDAENPTVALAMAAYDDAERQSVA